MSLPSPNPTALCRWEDSSALEHSCWACPTKSNSPKAIHSCYGVHSIPCMAYHSTMHAIGAAHRCSGCANSREMHDIRHREIAELIAEYHGSQFILDPAPTRRHSLRERPPNMQLRDYVRLTEGHQELVNAQDENDDASSVGETASTTGSGENIMSKPSKAELRERKKAIKCKKSLKKAAKNEARHTVLVRAGDIEYVEEVLHGDKTEAQKHRTHPLATDKTIEDVIARNLGFMKQIQSHKQALYDTVRAGRNEQQQQKRAKKRASEGFNDAEAEAIVDAVLLKFGIEQSDIYATRKNKAEQSGKSNVTGPVHNNKARIMVRLRQAIKDDLEKHENDLRQTYIRAGGFFRYAGKAVFERMTEIAKKIDLQTGEEWEKKRRREANEQDDVAA